MIFSLLKETIRQGCVDPWAASVLWKSSPSPPPSPDYVGAAVQTAAGNKENSIAAQQGSMVNQNTPYGSLTYSQDGNWSGSGNPQYTATTNLGPLAQDTLDSQLRVSQNLGHLTEGQLANVNQQYSRPMEASRPI